MTLPQGARLAVEADLIHFILSNNVAVVKKRPIWIAVGYSLRIGRIGWKSDFMARGGIHMFPVDELVKIGDKTYHVFAKRELKYATIAAIDKMVEPTVVQFKNPLVLRKGYLVFKIEGKDAKLVDAEPTHLLFVATHSAYTARTGIMIKPGNIIFNERVVCRGKSIALAVAIIPVNSIFTVCYSGVRGYRCHEMKASIPPIQLREFPAETPDSS